MFVQVIKGRTSDAEAVRQRGEVWAADVRPGAKGFLGSTVGVADDGTFFAIVRFEDEASAMANSQRPEQTAWWEETAKVFDGEPSFRQSSDTSTIFDGGSDKAGLRAGDGRHRQRSRRRRKRSSRREMLEQLRAARPDLLGGLRVWFDGGEYVEVAYFTSEEDARKGESSAEFSGPEQDFADAFGEMTFTDLRKPDVQQLSQPGIGGSTSATRSLSPCSDRRRPRPPGATPRPRTPSSRCSSASWRAATRSTTTRQGSRPESSGPSVRRSRSIPHWMTRTARVWGQSHTRHAHRTRGDRRRGPLACRRRHAARARWLFRPRPRVVGVHERVPGASLTTRDR